MNRSVVLTLPICITAIVLGVASNNFPLAGVLIVATLVASLVGARLDVDRGRQWVASVVGGAAGFSLAAVMVDQVPRALTVGWTRTSATLTMAAAARLILLNPAGGRTATLALATGAMLAAGETRLNGVYALAVVAFVGSLLLAFREDDASRPAVTQVLPRSHIFAALITLTAGAICVGSALGLREGQAWITKRLERRFIEWRARSGFSGVLDLGALDSMLDSDRIVLRVRGPAVDYLRGAVFDMYDVGRWDRSEQSSSAEPISLPVVQAGEEATQIQPVLQPQERFFVPLDAGHITATSSEAFVDPLGVLRPRAAANGIQLQTTHGPRENATVSKPERVDLYLPRRVRNDIVALALSWTEGASTQEEKLSALEQRLVLENRYSRSFERVQGVDPVLDFLLHDHRGHCEYFASAFALLARGAGVPSRVVTGFRVAEYVSAGKYWLVREKNAHAWVEAWIEGKGWITIDPTPADGVPQDQRHEASIAATIFDMTQLKLAELQDWLSNRTLTETAVAVVVGLAGLVAVILRGSRRKEPSASLLGAYAPPLQCLEILEHALEKRGYSRQENQSLESFAQSVPDEAARLLKRYAALRYGDVGAEVELASDIDAYVRSASRAQRA